MFSPGEGMGKRNGGLAGRDGNILPKGVFMVGYRGLRRRSGRPPVAGSRDAHRLIAALWRTRYLVEEMEVTLNAKSWEYALHAPLGSCRIWVTAIMHALRLLVRILGRRHDCYTASCCCCRSANFTGDLRHHRLYRTQTIRVLGQIPGYPQTTLGAITGHPQTILGERVPP